MTVMHAIAIDLPYLPRLNLGTIPQAHRKPGIKITFLENKKYMLPTNIGDIVVNLLCHEYPSSLLWSAQSELILDSELPEGLCHRRLSAPEPIHSGPGSS